MKLFKWIIIDSFKDFFKTGLSSQQLHMKKLCFNKVNEKSLYQSSIFNENHQELVPAEERRGDCKIKPRKINDLRGF